MRVPTYTIRLRVLMMLLVGVMLPMSGVADVAGYWSCGFVFGQTNYPQDMDLEQNGSVVTGVEYYAGTTNAFSVVTGSSNGGLVNLHFEYNTINYSADAVGSYTGNSMSGTWTSSANQSGTFTCTRTSGGDGSNPPGGGSDDDKRRAAISLFCNRTGVGLSVAKCSATVGDKGAPPRVTPTGSVDFVATGGFFPANPSCLLAQTPYSPGVSSCMVEFQIPLGFPVAAKFPIEAAYSGDATFATSATSHELISAGCVGTPETPCSGAVALGFADVPKIVKSFLSTIIACGGVAPLSRTLSKLKLEGAPGSSAPGCNVNVKVKTSAGKFLAEADDPAVMGAIAKQLRRERGARAFTKDDGIFIDVMTEMAGELSRNEKVHTAIFGGRPTSAVSNDLDEKAAEAIERMVLKSSENRSVSDIVKEILNKPSKNQQRNALKRKRTTLAVIATSQVVVRSNKQRTVKINFSKRFSAVISAFRKAGVTYAPISVQVTSARIGKVPRGAKRRVTITQDLSAILAK